MNEPANLAQARSLEVRERGVRDATRATSTDPGLTWTDAASWAPAPVSVVILTLNEEENIRDCLESCAWCDDVHVLDSGSTDRTCDIAREMGAGVHYNAFKSFGAQRNWAIDNIPMKHDWIFHLDADERFNGPLVDEMRSTLATDPEVGGYLVPSKLMFMGRWLKRTGGYPAYQMRLFHRERMRFRDYGHGQREQLGVPVGHFKNAYLHFNFSKGLEEWFDKHNRYSTQEAAQALSDASMPLLRAIGKCFTTDRIDRRRSIKSLAYRFPGRSALWIFYLMVLRRGFLDGRPGWNYARMRAIYESMIETKLSVLHAEQRRERNGR